MDRIAPSLAEVERMLLDLWIGAEDAALRREDLKKAREVAALLGALPPGRGRLIVDAAAGHGYVGLLHAHLSGGRLVVIERDVGRAARCREAAARLDPPVALELRVGEVAAPALWPEAPDLVVALHACGAASDAVIDRAIAARARWLYLVPCCYARAVPSAAAAKGTARAPARRLSCIGPAPRAPRSRRRNVDYRRMPIEIESPEQIGYDAITCNLSESSFADMRLRDLGVDLGDLVLQYHDHLGHPGLRAILAGDAGVKRDEVLVTVGAAAALFIISTSLLDRGDHLVVVRPNYATNIETPRAIGCDISYLDLRYEEGWAVDLERLAALLTPRTRLISLTCPHNPTGAMLDEATLRGAIALCERHGCRLLLDETYREMSFGGPLPCAAALSPAAISVSSLSKTYGLPGIRLGWLMTRDPQLFERFLAAKEQIFICNSIVDEEIGFQAMGRRAELLAGIRARIDAAFATMQRWMAAQGDLEWVTPRGGVVGFARLREEVAARTDLDRFYEILLSRYRTMVGPGHWFEQPRRYMRIGYGWPTPPQLEEGLQNLTRALADART